MMPKYRGAAPIQWAIANGETRTGVTTMRIDAGLDTGDILLQSETEIGPEETAVELSPRPGAPADRAYDAMLAAFEKGLMIRVTADTIAMSPPLIVQKAEIDKAVETLREVLRDLA